MHAKITPTTTKKYPIKVSFIYKRESFDRDDPIFKKIKELCSDLNIEFQVRQFDSFMYREDRDNITHLPALHIYEKGYREETFYPETRAVQIIMNSYNKFKNMKKREWDEPLKRLLKRLSLKTDLNAYHNTRYHNNDQYGEHSNREASLQSGVLSGR